MSTCRICGDAERMGTHVVPEMMYGTREEFTYFQCASCKCLQIDKTPDDLARHYSGNYYSYVPVTRASSGIKRWVAQARNHFALHGKGLVGELLHKRTPQIAMRSLRPLALSSDARVLDVGCGAGYLIHDLAELGHSHVLGIDPFIEQEINYPNGASVRKLDIDGITGAWDVIMFHHSFEHLVDPVHTLRRVAQLLAPGGHCLLRVPTVSSYAWQHYGVNWVQLDAPRHLFLFAKESMEYLSSATGLELTQVVYDSEAFQFWGSEQYRLGIPLRDKRSYAQNPSSGVFDAAAMAAFKLRAVELNQSQQGDQAAFYFRKAA
jgi:SAM-dependent methyltransferase